MKLPAKPGGTRSLLKDKRVQIGAAGAAVLGLVVLMKRGGAVDPAGAVLQPAQLDSSGTDLANALSAFGEQLSNISDQLDQRPTTGTGSDPTKNTPKPPAVVIPVGPKPAPRPSPKPAPKPASKLYATITRWGGSAPRWTQTLSGVASHYHTSVSALLKLNPSIKNPNLVHPGQKIRYR